MPIGAFLFVFAWLLVAAPADADPSPRWKTASTSGAIQTAPGGGEMIILGPALRYVTRAGVNEQGRVAVGCAQDGGSREQEIKGSKVSD